jgi:excisionase family DNA binding protein
MRQSDNEFYTPAELASLVRVGERWIEKQIPKRRIPGMTKVGRYWRFRRSEVDKQLLTGSLLLPTRKAKSRN